MPVINTPASSGKTSVVVLNAPPKASSIDKAKHFKQLVKEVNTILDDTILKLKKDRKLFRKAAADGRTKTSAVASEASSAKHDAKGNEMAIEAIETHVTLAAKDGAQAFIKFAANFRKRAKRAFWKSYNKADEDESKLSDLYHEITGHVGHAIKAMRKHGVDLNTIFLSSLKNFYKFNYECKLAKSKNKSEKTCEKTTQAKKTKMKVAQTALLSFQDNLKTAHHHGRKLRKRLKRALRKLHFVFKKARHAFRHTDHHFQAGYNLHYQAMRTISQRAVKKFEAEARKEARKEARSTKIAEKSAQVYKLAYKLAEHKGQIEADTTDHAVSTVKSAMKAIKQGTKPQKQKSRRVAHISKDAVHSAEIKAVKAVTKAANAILHKTKKAQKRPHRAEEKLPKKLAGSHADADMLMTSHKLIRAKLIESKADKKAAKKAMSIVTNAILAASHQQKEHADKDEVVPEDVSEETSEEKIDMSRALSELLEEN